MKIIEKGHAPYEEDVHCHVCSTWFSFTKSDIHVEIEGPSEWRHRVYYVYCPQCNHKQDVSAWAAEWFE